MSRRIELREIGDYAEGKMNQLLRVTVLYVDEKLKVGSPVDTGRFRASWDVGENSNNGGRRPEGEYPSTPRIRRLNYTEERVGNVYNIHNSLPYADRLANGWSRQATGPWIELIVANAKAFVKANAEKIRRS